MKMILDEKIFINAWSKFPLLLNKISLQEI